MSEVKTFDSVFGKCVLMEDYAALLEKCDALAAENAGMINVDSWVSRSDIGYAAEAIAEGNGADADESLRAGMRAIIDDIPTPATDAFLAEVRAHGVDSALKVMAGFTSDECGDSVYIAVKELAANLRQDPAHD